MNNVVGQTLDNPGLLAYLALIVELMDKKNKKKYKIKESGKLIAP